jgi:hypothetical protein
MFEQPQKIGELRDLINDAIQIVDPRIGLNGAQVDLVADVIN